MIPTAGNCLDTNFVANKIYEISQVCPIDKIATDTWNARDIMITLGDMGFDVVPFSQSIGHFNSPTKSMERLIRDGQCVIDKSQCVLWQFGNVELRMDGNGNVKPDKSNYQKNAELFR